MTTAEVYDGECDHEPDKKRKKEGRVESKVAGGTYYCPDCGASRGPDGKWRVLK